MTLRRFKTDPSKLSDHIADLLETQIKGTLAEEIAHCRKVQALFPILSILFHDQTRVEIFVQVKRSEQQPSDPLLNVRQTIHGVRRSIRTRTYHLCLPISGPRCRTFAGLRPLPAGLPAASHVRPHMGAERRLLRPDLRVSRWLLMGDPVRVHLPVVLRIDRFSRLNRTILHRRIFLLGPTVFLHVRAIQLAIDRTSSTREMPPIHSHSRTIDHTSTWFHAYPLPDASQ